MAAGGILAFQAAARPGNAVPGYYIGWGDISTSSLSSATPLTGFAGGFAHCLGIKPDGTLIGWGDNSFGQSSCPGGLSNMVAVSAGEYHSLALRSDGRVFAWGSTLYGQGTVPPGLSNVVAIGAGYRHNLTLDLDGTVFAWGDTTYEQTSVPPGMSNVVAIAAGGYHNLVLTSDGKLFAWGYDRWGQTGIPASTNNIVAIAAGDSHNLALRSNGTVLAWGWNQNGQCKVPPGLSNVVAIAAGYVHSMALKSDGTVVAWGDDYRGQSTVPAGLNSVMQIAAGGRHSMALVPPLAIQKGPMSQTAYQGTTAVFSTRVNGYPLPWFNWYVNEIPGSSGTNSSLVLTNLQYAQSGSYRFVATNIFGSVSSLPVMLNVIAPVEQKPVPAILLSGDPGSLLMMEYASALTPAPDWLALRYVLLSNSPQYFVDSSTAQGATRFYRARQAGTPVVRPSLSPPVFVPALTLISNSGYPWRVDAINQFGPTDAWFTLDTVWMTNHTQYYFDVSSVGQPPRCYRLMVVQ